MRGIILLLLVILVIAAVDARCKHKSRKHSRKSGYRIRIGGPRIRTKYTHKVSKSHYRHSHSYSHKVTHKISFKYNIHIKHTYKSEAHCSKHCVPDRAYWQGEHCLCHAGLAGAGDLCCTDPKEYQYTCTVRGDPYVHSYSGQQATVFNPCGQVLAVINAETTTRQTCHVTVRSADVIEQGVFITNQVEVSYSIDNNKREYVILDGYRYYSSLEGNWVQLGSEYSKCFSIHGEQVQVLQDKDRRVWTLVACGTIVNFRRDTRGGKPGVCVSSKHEYSQKSCDQPDDSVCNRLTHDTAPYSNKTTFYLAKSFEHKQYKNLRLSCAYGGLCKKITKTFNKCCPLKRGQAMNVCSGILEQCFRSCAYKRHGLDGAKLFELFGDCLKAYCDGDQQWCYTQMASATFSQCSLPNMHCCEFK